VQHERPILDYAPPPASLANRTRERISRHPILAFFLLRKLRATEVALIGWPALCLINFLCISNEYFLRDGFDAIWAYVCLDILTPGVAFATMGAVVRLFMTKRFGMGHFVLLFSLLIGFASGLLPSALEQLNHWPGYHSQPYERVPQWMNYLPYWKYF